MQKRRIGGVDVSAIGFGCMSLSGVYGKSDDAAGIALIRDALDRGVNLLDTSDMYGWGHNEELVGKAIAGRRDEVCSPPSSAISAAAAARSRDGRPEYVMSACDASLKRLGVDDDRSLLPAPRRSRGADRGDRRRHGEAGRSRARCASSALSEARPETIRRAHRVHPIAAVQNEYSLLYREEAEETLLHDARARHHLRRLLAARPRPPDRRRSRSRRRSAEPTRAAGIRAIAEGNLAHNVALVHRIETIAQRKGCTPGQLALAWLLAQGQDVMPIPGTKRKERLIENLGALSVSLSESDVAEISEAIPAGAAAGTRYPEPQMKSLYL